MRLWILSDLHMEMSSWVLPRDMADTIDAVVMAGDIHSPLEKSLRWLALQRDAGVFGAGKSGLARLIMTPGNHEYWHDDIATAPAIAADIARELGIDLLDRKAVVIGGVRFLGCTLWTDYALFGDVPAAKQAAARSMMDHAMIASDGSEFSPNDAGAQHARDLRWLQTALAKPHNGKTVVVTHHGVSLASVHARWANDPVTPAFSSSLDQIVANSGAALWVHGHTHDSFDYRIGTTRVVCNPKGYGPTRLNPINENGQFNPRLIVEV